jgi:hypothetical protein
MLGLVLLMGAFAAAGLGNPAASAASAAPGHTTGVVLPADCPPCIVAPVTPAPDSMVTPDASGKVTISATAQLANPYTKFFFIIDGTTVDTMRIQITATDPTQPTGTYQATLAPGQHKVVVQVDDSQTAPAASFSWNFTVVAPSPTATATKASGGGSTDGSGNTDGSSNTTSSGGFFSPTTLSIILFSIAGIGLLVITFIAGMWYGGRRWLSKNP